jgi:hypothetical protein
MKKITSELFKEYINVRDFKGNGGTLFSFIHDAVDLEADKYLSNLWLFDMEAGEIKEQLTFDDSVGMHEWVDEENLIITGARDEADKAEEDKGIPLTVFYNLNIKTKEYTKLFKVYKDIFQFARIDDDRYLLLSGDNPMRDAYLEEAGGDWDKYLEIVEREDRYFIADEVPCFLGASFMINMYTTFVFRLCTEKKSVCSVITIILYDFCQSCLPVSLALFVLVNHKAPE